MAYLDDILIPSADPKIWLKQLEKVLRLLVTKLTFADAITRLVRSPNSHDPLMDLVSYIKKCIKRLAALARSLTSLNRRPLLLYGVLIKKTASEYTNRDW